MVRLGRLACPVPAFATLMAVVTLPADNQILIRREFNAPKHLVYEIDSVAVLVAQAPGVSRADLLDAIHAA